MLNVLLAGGNWDNAANCSSRSRNANNVQSDLNANNGGRRAIRKKRKLTPSGKTSLLPAEHISLARKPKHKAEAAWFW